MGTLRVIVMVVLGLATLLLLGDASVLANGSKSKRVRYGAEVQTGDTASKRCRCTRTCHRPRDRFSVSRHRRGQLPFDVHVHVLRDVVDHLDDPPA